MVWGHGTHHFGEREEPELVAGQRQRLHRDVKPQNFLISAAGHLRIADLGFAFDTNWKDDKTFIIRKGRFENSKPRLAIDWVLAGSADSGENHNPR